MTPLRTANHQGSVLRYAAATTCLVLPLRRAPNVRSAGKRLPRLGWRAASPIRPNLSLWYTHVPFASSLASGSAVSVSLNSSGLAIKHQRGVGNRLTIFLWKRRANERLHVIDHSDDTRAAVYEVDIRLSSLQRFGWINASDARQKPSTRMD